MKKKRERRVAMLLAIMMLVINLIVSPVWAGPGDVAIDEENFPDENFRDYVSKKFDKDKDGMLTKSELDEVTKIYIERELITSFKGIEHFTELKELYCIEDKLTELDVKSNTKLTHLECNKNQLTTLDLSHNTELTYLNCEANQLSALNLSNNAKLRYINCRKNQLTTLDLSHKANLETLSCRDNLLTNLVLTNTTKLKTLYCQQNQLTTLDLSHNTNLKILNCDNNKLTALNLSKNTALTEIFCDNNQLSALDLSENTNLKILYCQQNKLTTLDLTNKTNLEDLYCDQNQLTTLDLKNNTNLKFVDCHQNQLTTLDLKNNTNLKALSCDQNQLTTLDLKNNTKLSTLYCAQNQLTTLDLSKNTKLTLINCSQNKLTTLDLKNNTKLKTLYCAQNKLTTLDLSKNTELTYIVCSMNDLTTLDLKNNTKLKDLYCNDNKLTNLDLSHNSEDIRLNGSNQEYDIKVSASTLKFDLKSLPGNFNPSMASGWDGGTVEGNILKLNNDPKPTTVKYNYKVNNGDKKINVTLNVEYGDVVTVTFNKNGKGGEPATIVKTIDKGSKVEKPSDPTDTDYDFGGWYKEAACTNKFEFTQAVNDNITLYAKWTKKTPPTTQYTLTASVNGGHGSVSPTTKTVNKDEEVTLRITPETGYDVDTVTVNGTAAGITGNVVAIVITMNENKTVVVKFKPTGTPPTPPTPETVTITFNANGHGTAPAAITVNKGEQATAPAEPTDDNYDFGGWYTEAACTNKFEFPQAVNDNITLYAKWTKKTPPAPETVTITFNANGHGTAPSPLTVNKGKQATAPAAPTDDNYDFGGWYREAECTNKFDFTKPVNGDITLFAKWTAKTPPVVETVTITFDANGHGTAPSPITVNKGTVATAPADPTDANYDFVGWYKEAECTNKFDFPQAVNENIRLYAKWTKKTPPPTQYTLTASVNGGHGSVSPTNETKNAGETVTLTFAPDPGYELDEVTVNDTETGVMSNVLNVTMDGDKTVVVKFKAVGTPPIGTPVTITFDKNGGNGTMADVTKNKGESFTLPACTFTPPAGKEFKAWQVDGTEKNVGDNIVLNGDKIIKAVWKDIGSVPPTPPVPPTPYTPYPWIVYPGWYYNYEAPKPKEENKVTKMEMDWKIELTIGISTIDREINGVDSKIKMDVAPYIRDGRTMLPLRSVAEALGFDVEWNRSTKTVVLRNSSTRVEIPVDTNKIILNGTVYTSDVKPEIKNNRTMLTIANIARALGLRDGKDIIWNSKSKMVTIYRSIIVK